MDIARHTPLFMGFPRQEYSSGLPFSSPGDLPDPRIELRSPALQVDYLLTESPGKPQMPKGDNLFTKVKIGCTTEHSA